MISDHTTNPSIPHPSVEFRALQSMPLSRSQTRALVARVLFTQKPKFKQQLALWSGSDLQPSTKLRFTDHQQHGQRKTQHCMHKKKSAELGRVVLKTQQFEMTRTRGEPFLPATTYLGQAYLGPNQRRPGLLWCVVCVCVCVWGVCCVCVWGVWAVCVQTLNT